VHYSAYSALSRDRFFHFPSELNLNHVAVFPIGGLYLDIPLVLCETWLENGQIDFEVFGHLLTLELRISAKTCDREIALFRENTRLSFFI
jgi:hypothetical protein